MLDRYRFGNSEVRPAERQLLVDGAPAALGGRAFDLLVTLLERRDRVVSKAELFDTVWPGLVVEENNLQVQVSALRKLLGSNAIATVPGRGYQFVAALAAGTPPEGAVAAAAATNPNNLPQPRTRFVGREKALDDCASLLRETRLLTLSGVGGCGKTRLARELAQRQLGGFPDGVWFVDLGPLQEARRVPATVAATLGMNDALAPPLERLTEHLRSRRTLMVLDNCEHVIDAAIDSIETLLSGCGALKIVATSREALGVPGEQIFAVRSLSLPATTDLEEMQRSEAVRLFVDHARLVVPDFAVDARNAAAIAEICRRLDGIALAIELAAARVRVLSVDEIRARLDDRFRLLTGGNRAMPRHQTLQATMQWSHDHLTAAEQHLFRRLAVFAGGGTLPAATQVAGGAADEYEMLERLTALHDKSLLVVDRDTQAQPRYRMLETVRQYAQERLTEAGEGDDVRNRHLDYYVGLATRAAPDLDGPRQADWYAALRHEQENLLAAHAWCAHAPQGDAHALRLIASLWRYWYVTSQSATGFRLAQAALELSAATPHCADRGEALVAACYFSNRLGRYDDALAFARQGLALGRALSDARLTASALAMSACALHATGEPARALGSYQESLELARAVGDAKYIGVALNGIAEIHRSAGDFALAEAFYQRATDVARRDDDPRGCAVTLGNLACVRIAMGQLEGARATFAESLEMASTVGNRGMLCCSLDNGAALAAAFADHATAARLHGAGLAWLAATGMRHEPVDAAFIAQWIARAREAMGAAAYEAAEAGGRALPADAAIAEMSQWLERAG